MGRALVRTIIACFILIGLFGPAEARRVALVIGNSAYEHASPLANPKNDADALAAVLERLDFEVFKGVDLKRSEFEGTVRDFTRAMRGADTALFFYAGHGLQVGGRNYLAPVDAKLSDEADLDFETLPLRTILKQMEREVKTNLVFLDACRDNPLARNLARSMGTRSASVGRGLARVDSGIGTLIAFATEPGNVALDGDGDNSPFTTALLKHIETPGLDIAQLMRRVRRDVMKLTAERQVPWNNSSLTGDFFFAGRLKITAGNEQPKDDKRITELQDELKKLKQQLKSKPAPQQEPRDDAKLSALQKELAELREELKKRPVAKPEPRDDKKMEAMQKELAALKKRLEEKSATKTTKPKEGPKVAVGVFPKQTDPAPTNNFKPGYEFQDCPLCPKMVVLPSGSFVMGSPADEPGREEDEGPQREVTIPQPFAVGKFEVTLAEWSACRKDGICVEPSLRTRNIRRDQPVHGLSWNDVNSYISWISRMTGRPYRLLKETEWEYAARAGTSTPFSTGETITSEQANFDARMPYQGSQAGQFRKFTMPVGSFPSNAFGLHDMHGNVWEWTEDCWTPSYVSVALESAKSESGICRWRIAVRGGAWDSKASSLRSALRDAYGAETRSETIGFRVARDLTPEELNQ